MPVLTGRRAEPVFLLHHRKNPRLDPIKPFVQGVQGVPYPGQTRIHCSPKRPKLVEKVGDQEEPHRLQVRARNNLFEHSDHQEDEQG